MFSIRSVPLRLAAVGIVSAAVAGAVVAPGSAAAAPNCPRWSDPVPDAGAIINGSDHGIGVFHLADGNCARGAYDVVLPPGKDTYHYFGWREVAGAYFGSGDTGYAHRNGAIVGPVTGPGFIMPGGGNWTVETR